MSYTSDEYLLSFIAKPIYDKPHPPEKNISLVLSPDLRTHLLLPISFVNISFALLFSGLRASDC